jgi:hypothetical protein
MVRSRMSALIMAGSPVLIVAMFCVLFEPGAFGRAAPQPASSAAITYWIAFAAFFFGLTFGLLQICTEMAIVRRERLTSVDVGPYLVAKAAVIAPVLVAVDLVMVTTLAAFGRLPALSAGAACQLLGILVLESLAGLALGLAASAAVANPAQAAMALPLLCFPAVLFSGAILPVRSMTGVGRAIAAVTSDRWAFEAAARTIDLDGALRHTPLGQQLSAAQGGAFSGSVLGASLSMAALTGALLAVAHGVLARRTRRA